MAPAAPVAPTVLLPQPGEVMFLETEKEDIHRLEQDAIKKPQALTIVWRNVAFYVLVHIGGIYGLYQFLFYAKWQTALWAIFLHYFSMFGIAAGSHRLWSHRAFKATLPARILFMIATTVAFQNPVIEWVRDHRCHHKWTDTDADPHNSKRGFFFSHAGWLLSKKFPQLKEMGSKIDLSDLYADPVLVFQKKNYLILALNFFILIPSAVPVYFWGEDLLRSFLVSVLFRWVLNLNVTWLINSAAHMFGGKPYDKTISPADKLITNFLAAGEGGHNFHHTFPQDYRTSEYGYFTNYTHAILDMFAWAGLIYDMKIATPEMIARQVERKGDGSYHHH